MTAASVFGTYESTYTQTGRELVIMRRLTGGTGIFLPQRGPELLNWLRAIGRDDSKFIAIDKPATPAVSN